MQHVYIIGSKGIPARYGGFETFVEKLTEYNTTLELKYHVSSMRKNSEVSISSNRFEHNGADVFVIDVPEIGPAKAVLYDYKSLLFAIDDAKSNGYENPIFYVLTSRIGPFTKALKKKVDAINGTLYLNPDGNEWKRQKWSLPVRKYWKFSERSMVKEADLIIADNPKIEEYIHRNYDFGGLRSTFIPYGTDTTKSTLNLQSDESRSWMERYDVQSKNYYLIVGRFVPENNYETMIKEFMKSDSKRDLVIITNVEKNSFYNKLLKSTQFNQDNRIKFVGTVYNQDLLKLIRENAYAYIHGHEVGGTNPSLLEAMATTGMNLIVDVDFNRAVARDSALYWEKSRGNLADKINQADNLSDLDYKKKQARASELIKSEFTWPIVVQQYEHLFLNAVD